MARVVALQEIFTLLRDEISSPDAQSALIARTAKQRLAAVEARQGVYPVVTVVDGREGVPVESVRADGIIIYYIHPFNRILGELLHEMGGQYFLQDFHDKDYWGPRFPFANTKLRYRHDLHFMDQWRVLLNGKVYNLFKDYAVISEVKLSPGDVAVIINPMPYARRIEKGVQGAQGEAHKREFKLGKAAAERIAQRRAGLAVTASGSGEMELAAKALGAKYKRFLNIEFTYMPLPPEVRLAGVDQIKDNRYPAIVVTVPRNLQTGNQL